LISCHMRPRRYLRNTNTHNPSLISCHMRPRRYLRPGARSSSESQKEENLPARRRLGPPLGVEIWRASVASKVWRRSSGFASLILPIRFPPSPSSRMLLSLWIMGHFVARVCAIATYFDSLRWRFSFLLSRDFLSVFLPSCCFLSYFSIDHIISLSSTPFSLSPSLTACPRHSHPRISVPLSLSHRVSFPLCYSIWSLFTRICTTFSRHTRGRTFPLHDPRYTRSFRILLLPL